MTEIQAYLMVLLLAFFVNFFVKSKLVIPASGFCISVVGILAISDSGMSNSYDQVYQYAFIAMAIGWCLTMLNGIYTGFIKGE